MNPKKPEPVKKGAPVKKGVGSSGIKRDKATTASKPVKKGIYTYNLVEAKPTSNKPAVSRNTKDQLKPNKTTAVASTKNKDESAKMLQTSAEISKTNMGKLNSKLKASSPAFVSSITYFLLSKQSTKIIFFTEPINALPWKSIVHALWSSLHSGFLFVNFNILLFYLFS